jgi:hypothetical protein
MALAATKQIAKLVIQVSRKPGMKYPAKRVPLVDAAKRLSYVREDSQMGLHLTEHGRLWLLDQVPGPEDRTFTKILPSERLLLKDLSRDTGVPMQEVIGLVLRAVHDNRDSLATAAREASSSASRWYPWDGIYALARRVIQ